MDPQVEATARRAAWLDDPAFSVEPVHYSNAPIIEAIVEFDCNYSPDATLDALVKTIPDAEPVEEIYSLATAPNDADESSRPTHIGYRFSLHDGDALVHSRLNGYSYIWLGKYESWDSLISAALDGWAKYKSVASPASINRIGVRFINRIIVPSVPVQLATYLNVGYSIPDSFPSTTSHYFVATVMPFDEARRLSVHLVSTTDDEGIPKESSGLILDIAAVDELGLDLNREDADDELLVRLRTLRRLKNGVFESCIRPATRELIS